MAHNGFSSIYNSASAAGLREELGKEFEATWRVSVPVVPGETIRPALDNRLLKEGKTDKRFADLSLKVSSGQVKVELARMRTSRKDSDETETFGFPLSPDDVQSVFGPNEETDEAQPRYDRIVAVCSETGGIALAGYNGEEKVTEVHVDGMRDPNYDPTVNYFNRMLQIPLFDGMFRPPDGTPPTA